jgi:hypothetical protein
MEVLDEEQELLRVSPCPTRQPQIVQKYKSKQQSTKKLGFYLPISGKENQVLKTFVPASKETPKRFGTVQTNRSLV